MAIFLHLKRCFPCRPLFRPTMMLRSIFAICVIVIISICSECAIIDKPRPSPPMSVRSVRTSAREADSKKDPHGNMSEKKNFLFFVPRTGRFITNRLSARCTSTAMRAHSGKMPSSPITGITTISTSPQDTRKRTNGKCTALTRALENGMAESLDCL